jgi:hypothetical protein
MKIETISEKIKAAIAKAEADNFNELFNRKQMYERAWEKACEQSCMYAKKYYYDMMNKVEAQLESIITLPKNLLA